jgi:hypothetical protein
LYAIGQHDAIGFSPFSIDSVDEETSNSLTQSYQLLTQLTPLILDHQGKGVMAGLLPEGVEQRLPLQLRFGDYVLNVSYERPFNQTPNVLSGGLVIAIGTDEFIFAGTGLTVTFESDKSDNPLVGILSAEEGKFEDGQWRSGRRLNGDQTHQGRHMRLVPGKFGIQRIKLYRYR